MSTVISSFTQIFIHLRVPQGSEISLFVHLSIAEDELGDLANGNGLSLATC